MVERVVRLLYVANQAAFFISHRLPLALAARDAGYEVHIASPDAPEAGTLRDEGFAFHPIPLSRRGVRVWEEAFTMRRLYKLYRTLQPDLAHHVTVKPILYGGAMARLARVPAVVHAVTGLGHVFVTNGAKEALLRWIIKQFYRVALGHPNMRVIFQNPEDRAMFLQNHLIDEGRAVIIKGAGVDMARFAPSSEADGIPVVVLASRMLWSKGVGEYVEAARLLQSEGVNARFVLAGKSDPGNPASIPSAQLRAWDESGVIEWWGYRDDMPEVFAQAHVICLPSYGEGVPKMLVEAAACARAIVTTDVPGCREVVRHGENGLLVPARDSDTLAGAIARLLKDPALRRRMGANGRSMVEKEFSLERVLDETLAVYRALLGTDKALEGGIIYA